jgi:hypothetical protein
MILRGRPNASQQAVGRGALCSSGDKRDRKHRFATQPGTRAAGLRAKLCEWAQRRTANLYHVGTLTIINAEKF